MPPRVLRMLLHSEEARRKLHMGDWNQMNEIHTKNHICLYEMAGVRTETKKVTKMDQKDAGSPVLSPTVRSTSTLSQFHIRLTTTTTTTFVY
mmetsp:Transcript_22110/g.51977  ORF Transcript_22110/g.51977 Transcript_22110/m.51977 type:complete len:92 (+) Transcript_22110:1869-2144(+)